MPEKTAVKPVRSVRIKDNQYQDIIDLFIFKKQESPTVSEYCMYVIASNGVLVFKSIEKKDESAPVSDEGNLGFTPNCCDCDNKGYLLVDSHKRNKNSDEVEGQEGVDNHIKKYLFRELKE